MLWGLTFVPLLSVAQTNKYQSSHKEIELNYGLIEDSKYDSLRESEKFRYSLTYEERTMKTFIDQDFNYSYEVKVDSQSFNQPWMNVAQRFIKNGSSSTTIKKDGTSDFSVNDEEDVAWFNEVKNNIEDNGYHPGLAFFPELPDSLPKSFTIEGASYEKISDGVFSITKEGTTITYDKPESKITYEYTARDGYKVRHTIGYTKYGENQGYLETISKTEKFNFTSNGTCVTEVKIIYRTEYSIVDPGNLIGKALHQTEEISISPNPNTGIFSCNVTLANNSNIQSVIVVNLMTNAVTQLPFPNSQNFLVDISNLSSGQYVIRVNTSNGTLTKHFIKN